jgi:flagellar motility protein MotE (MotC chaperone)
MSKERLQLNLRLDGHKELYEAVKSAAAAQDTSVNQFVINALRATLGWEVEEFPSPQKVEALESRLASLEERLAVVVNLEERLATLEQQRGKFQKSA